MADLPLLSPEQGPILATVLRLARTCEAEVSHTTQVTFLANRLFEGLRSLHHLGEVERAWLVYAGILHDIGWIEGWENHHKVSLRIILTTPMLPFTNKERLVIGSIARYHRKSLPQMKHDHFAALAPADRRTVTMLASFLRLADALDHSHQQRIGDIHCRATARKITISCTTGLPAVEEWISARAKCDLLEATFDRKVFFEGLE